MRQAIEQCVKADSQALQTPESSMKKLVLTAIASLAFFLTGCVTNPPVVHFEDYPPIVSGLGQLVIFSSTATNSTLRYRGEVDCDGIPCAHVVDPRNSRGVYSVHALTPRSLTVKGPGKKFILFEGENELVSNSLNVQIEAGKRTVVMVTLLGGREFYGNGKVGNATQKYQIDLVSESDALPKIRGLAEVTFKEALK